MPVKTYCERIADGNRPSEGCFDFQEEAFDLFQRLDHGEFFFCLLVLFEIIFSAFNSEFSAAEEIIYQNQVLYIYGPEKAVTFSILAGLKYIEFNFPVADQGLVFLKHAGYLTN